ncbi:XRE family transcriptional regulator [Microbulbifer variabilis]|uniref:XRE family transcriptional regulator n=1 Tax=Microbulbifer variabilis TaxID=266805 RepID=A0ABY4VFF5_9GAMM|nr:XRE family transcriptional regulator [Microbulbifer variabilis]USD22131.1 XRE family transcriptional regulator [Microbulbifer variabilis]
MTDLKDRLKEARKGAGKTQKQVAEAVGITQPSYSELENGRSYGTRYITQIATFLGVNPVWLASGTGTMRPPLIEEIRRKNLEPFLEKYGLEGLKQKLPGLESHVHFIFTENRPINSRTARKIEAGMDLPIGSLDYDATTQEANIHHSNVSPGPRIQGRVPLISWVQAGEFCETIDLFEPGDAEDWMPCPVKHSDRTYALRIQGDSMTSPYPGQKSYPQGTIIFVDPDKPLVNGCRVIAKLNGEATFKTYAEDMGHIYLRPINPTYSPMDVTDKEVTFCGVIIGSFSPE